MSKVTLGQILDLMDNNRESESLVKLMDKDGNVEACAKVCSIVWNGLENRIVNSLQANCDNIEIWLESED